MFVRDLVNEVMDAIKDMSNNHDECCTYSWPLGVDENGKDWAIVLGWQDGFDPEDAEGDSSADGTYHLCIKLAYNTNYMRTDYDSDWYMPSDEETGYVDDTETPVYEGVDITSDIEYLLEHFDEFYADEMAWLY